MRTAAPATTRWCPTAEQLMMLEEMYRSGVRTPHASQIQQITAQLARYGRIEGKNVFYWFQNHKARERQKLRRRLLLSRHCQLFYSGGHHNQHQTLPVLFPHTQYSPITTSPPSFLLHDQVGSTGRVNFFSESNTDGLNNVGGGGAEESNAVRNCMDQQSAMMYDLYHRGGARPLKTLDLFPTMSTGGLKDKDNNNSNAEPAAGSKSSCSTTTTN